MEGMSTINLLDHGYVQLVESWGSDQSVIEAARMSTNKGFNGWGNEETPGDEKLLRYLYEHKHHTPFEMAGMVIEVKAPIFVFREWHRHRTFSYNEMSARYVPLPDENYLPDAMNVLLRANTITSNKQAQNNGNEVTPEAVGKWLDSLQEVYEHSQRVYQSAIEAGIPKELARLPVPVARYSRMRASANLRNWLGFLVLRQAPNAQWEIRQYADAVAVMLQEKFPRTFELYLQGRHF